MKKTKSYFGNRFKSAVRGFRAKRSAKKEIATTCAIAASEFEVLEPRVLLSGVGRASTSKSWVDADGDKVVAKIIGRGAGIQVDVGSGRNVDAANINIIGADNAALSVVVSPVGHTTRPVQTRAIYDPGYGDNWEPNGNKTQNQWYNLTPGFTNIGSITAEASPAFGYPVAPTSIASINLTAVVVPVIDLGDAAVGHINFSTGRVAMVDDLMASNEYYSPGYFWTPGLPGLDVFDITAGSVEQINLSGHISGVNDFVGNIKITQGGLGRLTGTNSGFYGDLIFEGTNAALGNVVLGEGFGAGATISALGDMTFRAEDFDGLLHVGGHLNLQIVGWFDGTIIADGGVSGLRSSTTDALFVTDGDFDGQLVSGGDIADIIFNRSELEGGTIEAAGNIGEIRFQNETGDGTILAGGDLGGLVVRGGDLDLGSGDLLVSVGGTLGLIDVANGGVFGEMEAGTIGAVVVRGGNLGATLVAHDGGIGEVNVEFGRLSGTLLAENGDIGDITVLIDSESSAINGNIIAAKGSIGTIEAFNAGPGEAIRGANIFAQNDITAINASTVGEIALGDSSITALGSLGPITAMAFSGADNSNGAINGLTLVAPAIGTITATSVGGVGINNSNFTATSGAVSSITGSGRNHGIYGTQVTAATEIGSVIGTSLGRGEGIAYSSFTALGGGIGSIEGSSAGSDAILYSNFTATGDITSITGVSFRDEGIHGGSVTSSLGNVGNVSGTSLSPANAGNGIENLAIRALNGSVGSITGTANGTVSGDGLSNLNVEALNGIGDITGSAVGGVGINGGDYTVYGPGANIGNITGSSVTGTAIGGGADFMVNGGTIGNITATVTGNGGNAIGSAYFTAESFGDITVEVTNLAGGSAIDGAEFTSTVGDIGNITVTNASLAFGAFGIANAEFTSAGNIGNVTVTTNGSDSPAISDSDFSANENIGNIAVTTNGADSDGILNSTFTADIDCEGGGDIGTVTVDVNGVGSNGIVQTTGKSVGTTFSADNIGAVVVNVNNCDGDTGIQGPGKSETAVFDIVNDLASLTINNLGELADSDGMHDVKITVGGIVGPILVNVAGGTGIKDSAVDPTLITSIDVTATGENGAYSTGIDSSNFEGDEIGPINVTVTDADGGHGIRNSTFTATNGSIGDINASTAAEGNYHAIFSEFASFSATDSIGNITASAVGGSAIHGETFTADSDTDDSGDIGTITASSVDGNAIYQAIFLGANIGNISATVSAAEGNSGITFSSFKATAGNIGTVTASTVSTDVGSAAIGDSLFDADSYYDVLSKTTKGGNIGDISATALAGSAIRLGGPDTVEFNAAGNIGSFTAATTDSTTASSAVLGYGAGAQVIAGGNIGDIQITNDSTDAGANGLELIKFDISGTIGTVGITAKGGAAMNNSSIDPTSIGAITLSGASAAMTSNSKIVTSGAIDSLTVTGAIEAGSKISAGSITGATSVTGDLAGSIDTTGSIGAVTVSKLSGSINAGTTTGVISIDTAAGGSINAVTSIGNITITGTGDQSLTIKAPTVGNIDASNLADTKTATLTIDGSVLTIGNISVAAPTGTANLITQRDVVTPFNQLSTLGNVTVDGNWDNNNSLPLLTQIGNVSVGGGIGGGSYLGDPGNGMKITSANSGTVSVGGVTPGVGNAVTFNVVATGYTGTFTIDGTPYTNTALAPFNGTPVDGLTVNLL